MHEIYRLVLEEHYGQKSKRTQEHVARFYSSLPDPEHLDKDYVKDRIYGLAAQTQWCYLSFLRPVAEVLKRDLVGGFKPPTPQSVVNKADLYTREEIAAVLEACIETRDRAMMNVLYESGFRATEVLRLNIEGVQAEKALWWLTVIGKRNLERTVPIVHSVPALQQWMDVHPRKEGPLFVGLRAPFRRLTLSALENRVGVILKRAGVKRRHRAIHLFRHTRLTELASLGMSDSELCLFAGWNLASPMTETYVHLSGRDLKRGFSRVMGLEEEEPEPILKLEARKCPRCGIANSPGARFCSRCSLILDETLALRMTPPGIVSSEQRSLKEIVRELLREELDELGREE